MFLAGGIGVTPPLAMAKARLVHGVRTPITFVQAARNGRVHALAGEVRELAAAGGHVTTHVIYDAPAADDVAAGRCDSVGTVTTAFLRDRTSYARAAFYFCGPRPFMRAVYAGLKGLASKTTASGSSSSGRGRRSRRPRGRRRGGPPMGVGAFLPANLGPP